MIKLAPPQSTTEALMYRKHICSDRRVRRKVLVPQYFVARYMPAGRKGSEGILNGVGSNTLGYGEDHRGLRAITHSVDFKDIGRC